MNENMEYQCELITKWLRALMYIAIISLANSVISYLPCEPDNLGQPGYQGGYGCLYIPTGTS